MTAEVTNGAIDDAERNPDTLPTSTDPSGVCPRCGRTSNFTVRGVLTLMERRGGGDMNPNEQVAVLDCQGCGVGTLVVESRPPSRVTWDRQAVHWWPVPGAGQMDPAVPADIAEAYDEGVRCISVEAKHGAAVMARSALALIVADKASDTAKAERDLYNKIKKMVQEGDLPPVFKEWADIIRDTGNAGAHPEDWEPITLEQAEDRLSLVLGMIDSLYVQPARLQRMTRTHRRPKQTADQPLPPPRSSRGGASGIPIA